MTTSQPLPQIEIATSRRSIGRRIPTAARIVLGILFFVFGLNGFFQFLPPPAPGTVPDRAMAFAGALMQTGYMFPLIKGTEVLAGSLLLANRFVPLALTILAPVLVNIVAFHAFLAPAGLAIPIVALVLEAYLAWSYRSVFVPMLAQRTTLGRGEPS